MARPKKWPPTIHNHRSSGQARIRIEGRDLYLGPWGTPEATAEYRRVVALYEAGRAGSPPASRERRTQAVTVEDVVAEWWNREAPRLTPRGRECRHHADAQRPWLRLFARLDARLFDCNRLEELQLAMATGSWMTEVEKEQRRQRGQPVGWCRNVVNKHVVRVRGVWRWAERKGLVPAGSWGALRATPGLAMNDARVRQTKKRQGRDLAELEAVCGQAHPTVAAILRLCWWTGMRPGEARTMRHGDLERTGEVWLYRPREHKNDWRGQDRVVCLGPKAQEIITPFLTAGQGVECYLFPTAPRPGRAPTHPCYGRTSFCRAVRLAAQRAGVAGFTAYLCRHSAKRRLTRAEGLDAARAVLGQRSIQTTDSYDAGVDLDTASAAAQRLG